MLFFDAHFALFYFVLSMYRVVPLLAFHRINIDEKRAQSENSRLDVFRGSDICGSFAPILVALYLENIFFRRLPILPFSYTERFLEIDWQLAELDDRINI